MTIYHYVFSPGEGYTLSTTQIFSDKRLAHAILDGLIKAKEESGRKTPPYIIDVVDDNHKVFTVRGGGF